VAIAPIEAGPGNRVAPHHVEFFVDDGQSSPQIWRRRGCATGFPYESAANLEKGFGAFLATVGRDALFEPLRASGQGDRR
jgi:hypothetical protein